LLTEATVDRERSWKRARKSRRMGTGASLGVGFHRPEVRQEVSTGQTLKPSKGRADGIVRRDRTAVRARDRSTTLEALKLLKPPVREAGRQVRIRWGRKAKITKAGWNFH